ncbi:MAG TPA: hypothetical protein VH988_22585 [Thermoanaerobaculia bacterium]|nr:hypothetical protein [Thermoanaerobaculia bacterium]
MKDKIWQDVPVWAQDQEVLFESSVQALNLSPEDILADNLDLGFLGPFIRPAIVELLKSGKLLGQVVADPSQTFVTVRGNKLLESAVQTCMTQNRDDRIRDLKASILAALERNPKPFDIFDKGLQDCVRQIAPTQGVPLQPDDIRIWTALEDRSR